MKIERIEKGKAVKCACCEWVSCRDSCDYYSMSFCDEQDSEIFILCESCMNEFCRQWQEINKEKE